jgi:xanthine dehydrogenase iron-sulfur cluster and FAD-binding subunit A
LSDRPNAAFCQNGQIVTAMALHDKNPSPTDAQIRQGMAGTLCRCMTYDRIHAAIKRAAKAMALRRRVLKSRHRHQSRGCNGREQPNAGRVMD